DQQYLVVFVHPEIRRVEKEGLAVGAPKRQPTVNWKTRHEDSVRRNIVERFYPFGRELRDDLKIVNRINQFSKLQLSPFYGLGGKRIRKIPVQRIDYHGNARNPVRRKKDSSKRVVQHVNTMLPHQIPGGQFGSGSQLERLNQVSSART